MSISRARKLILLLSGLFVVYALIGWLAVPRILQSKSEQYVLEKTGYRLAFDLPEFNPFTFDLDIQNVRLENPEGARLLSIAELDANLAALRRGLAFDSVRIETPQVSFIIEKDGKSNWSEFLEKLSAGGNSGSETRLAAARLDLEGGKVDFRDERKGFQERIEPVELKLSDFSTWPGESGGFSISARTRSGISLSWQGRIDPSGPEASGRLALDNLDSGPLSAYLKGIPSFEKGSLSAELKVSDAGGKIGLDLDDLQLKAARIGLKPALSMAGLEARSGRFRMKDEILSFGQVIASGSRIGKFLGIGSIRLGDVRADFPGRSIFAGEISLEKGSLNAVRKKNGDLDIPDVMRANGKAGTPPWHYRVGKLELAGFSAALRDESVSPEALFQLRGISFKANGISDEPSKSADFRASMESSAGGELEAEGRYLASRKSVDMNVRIRSLSLKPVQPYLSSFAALSIADGMLDASGHAAYDGNGARYSGSFSVENLRLLESGSKHVLLSWKSLSTRNLKVNRSKLDIATIDIDRPFAKLIIARDRSVNISRILEQRKASSGPGFPIDIGRIRVRRGEMDYADHSLALPFGTRIHALHGFVNGISSSPGTIGRLQLRGRVNTYGSVNADGQINPFDPARLTDIKVKFRDIEMTRLTPYSATFAGRKITSGKLSLDLDYRVKDRRLTGDNRIVMDNLALGDRVKSPEAKDLPLDLAIAVLQDSDGRIDLGLPVSGSLDDPKFSYGGIIWEAVQKIFEKIVTSPFRLLGALFGGGGGEAIGSLSFDPGRSGLSPPEYEKIANLAVMLKKRPGLALTVRGVYSSADRVALQDLMARRAVAGTHGDPGPLAIGFPGTRKAIEALFSEKFGDSELYAMKEGYIQANPGKMKRGLAERMKGLFTKKRALAGQEIEALKGADFDEVLYKRLRDAETVPESELVALGEARGRKIFSALSSSGAPMDRVKLESPVMAEGNGQGVSARMELVPASR